MDDLHGIFQTKLSPDKLVDVFVCFMPQKYLQQHISLVSSKVTRTQYLTRLDMKGTSANIKYYRSLKLFPTKNYTLILYLHATGNHTLREESV